VPAGGTFVAPTLIELERVSDLKQEVFGPVLHIVRYRAEDLDRVIADIAASGYGLTLGIHTRIDATVERIIQRLPVGNIYVNRNMIGAVVGTQPFGGVGLSGTGPKAGGPNYVRRFASEQTVSINTAAAGGNATLLAQGD
jgi:RHH-type proline utilization regulon transcriptional repressor/proline dehydrogenase/delta 1-pyrroline-5-carboxylate dehydrogenase